MQIIKYYLANHSITNKILTTLPYTYNMYKTIPLSI